MVVTTNLSFINAILIAATNLFERNSFPLEQNNRTRLFGDRSLSNYTYSRKRLISFFSSCRIPTENGHLAFQPFQLGHPCTAHYLAARVLIFKK